MGFIKTYYVPDTEEIIDNAFSAAKKEADVIQEESKDATIKAKEKKRIKVVSAKISKLFKNIVKNFPSLNQLDEFYKLMLENSLDLIKLKKALGHISKTEKLIESLKTEYLIAISKKPAEKAGTLRREFYGRVKSIVKKTTSSLEIVKNAYKVAAELPRLKNYPVVLFVGLPNVGKSTLLRNLTGAKVEIRNYPFTTKKIQIGYLNYKYLDFQIVDSPGILDRPEKKLNNIEKKAIITLKHLANSLIFVFDPWQNWKQQINLIKKYNYLKHFIVITKAHDFEDKKDLLEELKKVTDSEIVFIDQEYDFQTELENIKELIYKYNKDFYRK